MNGSPRAQRTLTRKRAQSLREAKRRSNLDWPCAWRPRDCFAALAMTAPLGIGLRRATQDDLAILWDFLAIAGYEADVAAAKAVPFVAAHLEGWRRSEDFGFIAETRRRGDRRRLGAAIRARRATGVLCRRPHPRGHHRGKRGCPRPGRGRKAAARSDGRSGAASACA